MSSVYAGNGELQSRTLTDGSGIVMQVSALYDNDGNLQQITRASNAAGTQVVSKTTYGNDDGRPTSVVDYNGSGGLLDYFLSAYNVDGQLTQENDSGTNTYYGYDATGELTSANSATYQYDANGNRSAGTTLGPDNEVLSDGTWNYTYDPEGNETKKVNSSTGDTWLYGYDNANHLVSVTEKTSTGTAEMTATYKYDVFGNRVETDVWTAATGTVATRFAYDGWNPAKAGATGTSNFDAWAELSGSNTLETRYLDGDAVDQVFGRINEGVGAFWLLADHLGSVRDVLNSSGTLVDQLTYDAFGNVITQTNAAETGRYTYTGQVYDTETGLLEERARFYAPTTGRWMSQDPMGYDAGDSNLYRYVNNRPSMDTDPSGDDDAAELAFRANKEANNLYANNHNDPRVLFIEREYPQYTSPEKITALGRYIEQQWSDEAYTHALATDISVRKKAEVTAQQAKEQEALNKLFSPEARAKKQDDEYMAVLCLMRDGIQLAGTALIPPSAFIFAMLDVATGDYKRAVTTLASAGAAYGITRVGGKVVGWGWARFLSVEVRTAPKAAPLVVQTALQAAESRAADLAGRAQRLSEIEQTFASQVANARTAASRTNLEAGAKLVRLTRKVAEEDALEAAAEVHALRTAASRPAGTPVASGASAPVNGRFVNCFPLDTLVSTEDGLKPIQNVRASELVWAYDLVAGLWKLRQVVETYQHDYVGDMVAITVASEVIKATSGHTFWVVEGQDLEDRPRPEHVPDTPSNACVPGRWVDAGDLRVGDILLMQSGQRLPITEQSVHKVCQKVYNFHVEELHCYAVGTGQILVHNNSAINNIVNPGGNPIGVAGSSATIREVAGSTAADAQAMFNQLSQGGTVVTGSTYPGTLVRLPSGGTVGLRTVMTNSPGTIATIDVKVPGVTTVTKIKFNP